MDDIRPMVTGNGAKIWYLNNSFHRVDGPAIIFPTGDESWYLHGKRHCEVGPAIDWIDMECGWFLHGEELTFNQWLAKTTGLTEEEKVMMKLQYG
jgi:hypothetical protein